MPPACAAHVSPNASLAAPPLPNESAITKGGPPNIISAPTEKIVSDKNVDISLTTLSTPSPTKEIIRATLNISTGDEADKIHISRGEGGQLNALINGKSYLLPVANNATTTMIIETKKGDDTIHIDPDVKVNATIKGGEGDDNIRTGAGKTRAYGNAGNDTILLGSANSYAEGNDGDDTLMGGIGSNVMYGGNGKDRLYAGYGPETKSSYMDGGNGDDVMHGGSGHNIMHGGKGNDQINGYGRSHIYTGRGQDSVTSVSSDTVVHGKRSDYLNLPFGFKFIETQPLPENAGRKAVDIEGSPAYRQRVEDDLEFLRGSPNGQKMLKELDAAADRNGAKVTVLESPQNLYFAENPIPKGISVDQWRDPGYINDGTRGSGTKMGFIGYNTSLTEPPLVNSGVVPPVTAVYHEFSHSYNGATGSALMGTTEITQPDGTRSPEPNIELQVIGLNTNIKFDYDDDPSTPQTSSNPYPLTENAIREEMGLPLRKSYNT